MRLIALVSAMTASLFALSFASFAHIAGGTTPPVVAAQSDCQDGETWNEDSKKCEKAESAE